MKLDENSDLPITMISAETPEELISIASEKAQKGDKDSERLLSQLTRKIIHNPKPLNMEFQGNIKDFMRSEPIINENDSSEGRALKQAKIERLRKNRCSWSNVSDY